MTELEKRIIRAEELGQVWAEADSTFLSAPITYWSRCSCPCGCGVGLGPFASKPSKPLCYDCEDRIDCLDALIKQPKDDNNDT